jgi:integrin beta 1
VIFITKLGGIIKPNDGRCHLDSKGEYTYSTLQDYPSVAQINSKVKEKSINLIFAATAEQIKIYERLSQQVQGSSCGVLAADSRNVVELVKEQYQVRR